MSTPTNKLSRSPAFKQFYYRNLERMADRFEADTLAELLSSSKSWKLCLNLLRNI